MKIIFSILWFGIMTSKALLAQDLYFEKTENADLLYKVSIQDNKLLIQTDTSEIISLTEKDRINLPFDQFLKNLNIKDITVINPSELLQYDNIITVNEAIGSRVPGAYGTTNFRGLGNALVIVDGFPRNIANVNIKEVEQITILKDASSSVFYGVQANNGVIMIKTKRGKARDNKITAQFETGLSFPVSFPKYLGSARYMELYNEALKNDGLDPLYPQELINGTTSGVNPTKYPDIDYYNSTFLKDFIQRSRLETEFSGGSRNAQFYANLGWQRTGDLVKMVETPLNTDRLNFRSNLDFRINDFINTHVDLATIFNISNVLPRNFYSNASTLKPNYYPPLIDTALVGNKNLIQAATLVEGKYLLGGTSLYQTNIYGDLLLGGYSKNYNTIGMFNVGIDFDLKSILQGLTFKTYTSLDFITEFSETQSNTYAIYEPRWLIGAGGQDSLSLTKIGTDKFSGTQGIANTSISRDFSLYGVLDYSRDFDVDHSFSASLLSYYDQYNASTLQQTDKHMHLGTKVNYIYKNKYIFNINSAIVSSPKLSSKSRIAISPTFAAGWIISEEEFLKNNSFINYFKFKLSAGIINTDINLTRYFSYYDIMAGSANYVYGPTGNISRGSTVFTNIANPNLSYEKRKEFTIGAEAILFDNLLWLELNYFRDHKTDQFVMSGLSNTYPAFLGGLNPVENYNHDRYSGLEAGFSVKKSYGHFSFDIGPSLLLLNTEIIKRDEFYGEDYLYRKGKSTGVMFGLEALGLFKSQAEIDAHVPQMFGPVKPGDIKYKDQNNDGIIDTNDEIEIGNSLSNFVGGLNILMKYKNLSLFALASARNGAQIMFTNNYYWIYGNLKYSKIIENRWTEATSETASYPRLTSQTSANNFRSSTFWLEDNKLLSLARIQLTYDLPQMYSKKVFANGLSLYLRGSNIVNIAKNKDKLELNIGSGPQYRNYAIGIKAIF